MPEAMYIDTKPGDRSCDLKSPSETAFAAPFNAYSDSQLFNAYSDFMPTGLVDLTSNHDDDCW